MTNRKMETTADFVCPEILWWHLDEEAKEGLRKIAREYWFLDVNFIKSESLPTGIEDGPVEHPFRKFK